MATMKDISKMTGLSSGTISRYINNSGYVSRESADKIQRAIDEINYIPNEHARVLYNKSSNVIGLIVPSLVNPFFAQMATVLEKNLNEKGYSIILYNTNDNSKEEAKAVNMLRGFRVDGILVGRPQNRDLLKKVDVPAVSFETEIGGDVVNITADNFLGGMQAFNALYDVGCRKILHIKGPDIFEATELRYKGFKEASNKKEDVLIETISFSNDFDTEFSVESVLGSVDLNDYDGIFVFNDIAAAISMSYITKKGFKIPDDIQVMGFDNSYLCELLSPKLSTIEQPFDEISKECVDTLISMIKNEKIEEKTIRVKTNVVLRESTKKL